MARRRLKWVARMFLGLCALLGVLALLWYLGCAFRGEDFSDIRFYSWAYLGRRCKGLKIEAKPWEGSVTVTNNRDDAIRQLRFTTKYFGHNGTAVTEWTHEALGSAETIKFDVPPEAAHLDLGMIYVRVWCDKGVAVERGWWSYWGR